MTGMEQQAIRALCARAVEAVYTNAVDTLRDEILTDPLFPHDGEGLLCELLEAFQDVVGFHAGRGSVGTLVPMLSLLVDALPLHVAGWVSAAQSWATLLACIVLCMGPSVDPETNAALRVLAALLYDQGVCCPEHRLAHTLNAEHGVPLARRLEAADRLVAYGAAFQHANGVAILPFGFHPRPDDLPLLRWYTAHAAIVPPRVWVHLLNRRIQSPSSDPAEREALVRLLMPLVPSDFAPPPGSFYYNSPSVRHMLDLIARWRAERNLAIHQLLSDRLGAADLVERIAGPTVAYSIPRALASAQQQRAATLPSSSSYD